MELIEFKNLCKNYGSKEALKNINLKIEKGKIYGLLGPNGSGKTTLIKIINDLLQPTSGEVLIQGKEPGIESKKIISFLPERTYLNMNMKVSELIQFFKDFYQDFEDKMKTTKSTLIDKEYVKVKKDTFDSMNNVINETKKAMEFQPKMEQLFIEVDSYTKSHQTLEKENQNLQREVKALTTKNQNLNNENKNLKQRLEAILKVIKQFFRKLLQIGNESTKAAATNEIKAYYDTNDFESKDVYDISKGTTKEDELFDYAEIPDYYKTSKKSYGHDKDKDDYEISL